MFRCLLNLEGESGQLEMRHTADTDFQVTSSQRECLCAHVHKATSILVAILKKDGIFSNRGLYALKR